MILRWRPIIWIELSKLVLSQLLNLLLGPIPPFGVTLLGVNTIAISIIIWYLMAPIHLVRPTLSSFKPSNA